LRYLNNSKNPEKFSKILILPDEPMRIFGRPLVIEKFEVAS
jgi:hypothetical protein